MDKIFVIDGDGGLLDFVKQAVNKDDYIVTGVSSSKDLFELAQRNVPQALILDLVCDEKDGVEICLLFRNSIVLKDVVIIFVTSSGEDYSQIAAFSAGADDYIILPVSPVLLGKRITSLLRRRNKKFGDTPSSFGEIKIDKEKYVVIRKESEIALTKIEFELLSLLISNPKKVFTREELYARVWKGVFTEANRTVDVHVRKLREKVGEDIIKTFKGVGYSLT